MTTSNSARPPRVVAAPATLRARIVLSLVCIAWLSGSCGLVPVEETVDSIFKKPVSVAAAPPALAHLADDPEPYQWPDYEHANGKITRTMWLAPGTGALLDVVLAKSQEWSAVERTIVGGDPKKPTPPLIRDPNADAKAPWPAWKDQAGLEAVILSGDIEKVDACTALIEHTLSSIPQVLIEARVVEVVESDEFGLGFDWFTLESNDHPYDPTAPISPLDPSKTVFDRGVIGTGIPPLPGIIREGLIPNALVNIGTVKDNIQVDLLISALSQLTKIDVVNAPNVAVRSGHIAAISAGQEIPYFTVNVSGSNQTVSTKFKNVAVNLAVLPTLTAYNRLTLAVTLSVDNITGISTVETGGAQTSNPVISSRKITTTMDVVDGSTVVLGGLIQTQEFVVDEKVPVLGDVPIMGYLFTNTHTQDSRSNLLFFIRPKILNPKGGSRDAEIILPPTEDELLGPEKGKDEDVIAPPPGGKAPGK